MRKCKICDVDKTIDEFHKNMRVCKICFKEKNKRYQKKWKDNNPLKVKEFKKNWYEKNKENVKFAKEKYKNENHNNLVKTWKKYRENNREKLKMDGIKYRKKNRYRLNKYAVDKRNSDPILKLSHNVRGRIRGYLNSKDISKKNKTFDIIGCTPLELKEHLERQFIDDMSWENYGYYGWHVDHKTPLDSGKTEEEILKLCHYHNLQPLWRNDNQSKSNKKYD